MSHEAQDLADGVITLPAGRFLEYTSPSISAQLRTLSTEAVKCICSWPSIVIQEGRGQEAASVARITSIDAVGAEVKITVTPLSKSVSLFNETLWKLRTQLDIEQFEFNRNHWAIKNGDLFLLLSAAGHEFDKTAVALFENLPLPFPARSRLLEAKTVISQWSHSRIDDLLLQAGVNVIGASRSDGGREARAKAIVSFVLANPSVVTAENSLFGAFIARAAELPENKEPASAKKRKARKSVAKRSERAAQPRGSRASDRVFIVHGQNDAAKVDVCSFLADVGLTGIVLHEQPSMGRHLLTKFIQEAELVTFAVVLMTDDDVGGKKGSDLKPRARQNVVLELGYFLSHLGQARVCALITPGLQTPSDFDGIAYIRMDGSGHWKAELLRELRAAKMPIKDPPQRGTAGHDR